MPSIPQSLLWISLVVLWLFVLVPMLISKRDAVRRTSDVALATRVLTDGRSSRLVRRGPAAGHRSDPDWQVSDDHLDDEDRLEDADDDEPRRAVVLAAPAESRDAEPDYLDVDVVDEDSGALPVGASVAEAAEESDVEDTAETTEDEADDEADEMVAAVAQDEVDDLDETDEVDAADEVDELNETDEVEPEPDGRDDDYEYVDDSSGLEAPSDADLRTADAMAGSRRRRYESKTAEAVAARKFRFRQRAVTTLAFGMLLSALIAFFATPTMWWICGAFGAAVVLYLAYLRRQTRIEAELRRRRAQRLARSRLGVENTRDREFDVVPARLRRPGAAVLDIDDEDPIFEHLDYAPAPRGYDLPRAAGQ
ncbi:divisome protein SepX/GlpR [Mycolicibacterium thermoresistibile]